MKKPSKKVVLISVAVAIFVVALFILLETTNRVNLFPLSGGDSSDKGLQDSAKTTSTLETAQNDFTGGTDRAPAQSNTNEGTVETNSSQSSVPDESQWSVSNSGLITVYSPSKNGLLSSGDALSGKSTLAKVSFRLIDNVTGVIIQGDLPVENGTFSGKFNFSTTATEGRLDIFSASPDGVEQNNVELPVRFK